MTHEKGSKFVRHLWCATIGALCGFGIVAAVLSVGAAFMYVNTNYGAPSAFLFLGVVLGGSLVPFFRYAFLWIDRYVDG